VIVPFRCAPSFALTANDTVPLPLPAAPVVSEIQVTSTAAVHAQSAVVETVTFAVPPFEPML
jgi:hypothetical protein